MTQRVSLFQLSCFIMLTSATAAAPAAAAFSDCRSLDLSGSNPTSGAPASNIYSAPTPAVVTQLYPGQLEPQIRRLLKQHLAIKVLDWQASPHHQWPTEHQLSATSWAEILRRILQPYDLQLVMYPNHSAVVRYRTL